MLVLRQLILNLPSGWSPQSILHQQWIRDTFHSACMGRQQDVELLKGLAEGFTAPIMPSLSRNNTVVADWLEYTYKVMSMINSTRGLSGQALVEIFNAPGFHSKRNVGLTWFLQHITAPEVEESCVRKATHIYSTKHVQRLYFMVPFLKETVLECFSSPKLNISSSKVLKWLVTQFHIQAEHIKSNQNLVLSTMLNEEQDWLL
ncbi:hypothetical protein Pelo_16585 [Pelomyxa schiedti]|nr:hypothetical protein Pelo_16585 [Pelomyxa schiedti]